jgi:hypothetical protein
MISQYLIGTGIFYNKSQQKDDHLKHRPPGLGNQQALRQYITQELEKCLPVLWPRISMMRHRPSGLCKMTEWIIQQLRKQDMCLGSAIVLLERELIHIL